MSLGGNTKQLNRLLFKHEQRKISEMKDDQSLPWRDWGQEEKGMTENEMVGWHHPLNGHEFE